jgi:hypothetical protein
MNYTYDEKWDKELSELMEHHNFTQLHTTCNINGKNVTFYISTYEAKLGDTIIWTSNHPYASFVKCDGTLHSDTTTRPSKQTIYLARKKLKKDMDNPGWFCEINKRRNKTLEQLGIQ